MRTLFVLFFLCMPFAAAALAADLPLETQRLLGKAAPLMERKNYAQAARILDEGLARQEARHTESWCALANCRLMLAERQDAIYAYNQALHLDPKNTRAWQGLARAQYENKNFKEAGRAFAQAYVTGKKDADVLYNSAMAYLMAGSYKDAISQFDKLFQGHPKAVKNEWREHYIHALVAGGQGKKALPLVRKLVDSSSSAEKLPWQELLLHQYVKLGMYQEARQYARELTDADPGAPRWWRALVHIQLAAGRMEDALAALLACSHVTRLKPEEQRLMADLYMQTGIPAKAVPLYHKHLSAGDRQKRSLRPLVMAYRQLGQDEKALALLEQYRQATDDASLLMLQGELCYGLKRYQDAAASFRQASQKQGQHQGQAWLMAGYAALQMKDTENGLYALNQASRFDSQKKQAQSLLKTVLKVN